MSSIEGLAKIIWEDPETGQRREYVLEEGATATIGRSASNPIYIPERHVSRQHAVIRFQNGIFMLSDLGSANGTFVNDKQLTDQYPLMDGDVIRLYVPILHFSAMVTAEEHQQARLTGTLVVPASGHGQATLHITSGPQEGAEIPLITPVVKIGRATQRAMWDISLQDRTVSRPHCEIVMGEDKTWAITDLDSVNGTLVNDIPIAAGEPHSLLDGYVIKVGETTILFRLGNES